MAGLRAASPLFQRKLVMKAPIVADIVLFHPGRDQRHGGHAPRPAIVQHVNQSGDYFSLTLTVFGFDGGTFLAERIVDRDAHAMHRAAETTWDADSEGFWTWPEGKVAN
jgi:hypothetical protein